MAEWNKDSFPIGTRVVINDHYFPEPVEGTVVAPIAYDNEPMSPDDLWINPDENKTTKNLWGPGHGPMHGWGGAEIKVIGAKTGLVKYCVEYDTDTREFDNDDYDRAVGFAQACEKFGKLNRFYSRTTVMVDEDINLP